jgi:hypothetical protein
VAGDFDISRHPGLPPVKTWQSALAGEPTEEARAQLQRLRDAVEHLAEK